MSVGELRERVSSAELAYWRGMYRIDPWGEQRADLRLARWCAMWANAHRDKKKHPQAFNESDFLLFPERDPAEKRQRVEAANLRAHLKHLLRSQKGK